MRLTTLLFWLMVIGILVVGCNPSHQPDQKKELASMREVEASESESVKHYFGDAKIPFELNENVFHTVSDWKDDHSIFYIVNSAQGSEVHIYNLITGESSLFFQSEAPIVQFEANSNQSLFLVHTSPTSYEAELIILDTDAKVKFRTKIESYELEFTWNQINPNKLFISSFNEDWTYQTYILDVNKKSVAKNPVDIPFIQWLNDEEISYLKWDQETPSLSAPLYIYNIEEQEEKLLANNVIANTNFTNVLSTIELVDENGSAVVHFYDREDKSLTAEMPTRLVALYSDWSIPYHEMYNKGNTFFILEVNEAKTDYSLISFDLENGEKKTLIEDIENLPIKLSPNGEYALYGARFEHFINLKDKEIKELITLK